MFTHIVVGSNDLARSQRFYDAIFGVSGGGPGQIDAKGRVVYAKDGFRLLVTKPINGEPATFANGGTIGLLMAGPEMVDAWHAAGIANGGTTAEDPPGIRPIGPRKAYIAYLRDPDGNKLCASCRVAD
jgi:catechol 2,3-dioxygenase-like lactoylglutathione lyase family enzyme